MNEIEKMKAGMWYDANHDPEIVDQRYQCMDLCYALNQLLPSHRKQKDEMLKQLLPYVPDGLEIVTPFTCDYGKNIFLGHDVFINSYCYLMDGAPISIGNHVFIGPYCGFYTASHPIDYESRDKGLEKAFPIRIGDHCWFGANVSVMPGVSIGNGCVIAAGSVVTKDVEDNSLVAGVPAQIIKKINQEKASED